VTDVQRIVDAASAVGARVLLDGAQRTPHGPIDIPSLGVDLYVFSGHKMYGPNASGALWGRREVLDAMPPFMTGGHMIDRVSLAKTTFAKPPQRFEAGTPMIAQAVGFGAAADWLMTLDWRSVHAHTRKLAARLLSGLNAIPGVTVVGPATTEARLPVISFTVEGYTPLEVCGAMDKRGIALRGGHHCAQPAMAALRVEGTARASIALYNTLEEVETLLDAVETLCVRSRRSCP
jgi:cysteine desulfurase/selenocysteine lyase